MKRHFEEVQDAFAKIKNLEKDDKLNAAKDEKRAKEIETLTQEIESQTATIAEMEAAGMLKLSTPHFLEIFTAARLRFGETPKPQTC